MPAISEVLPTSVSIQNSSIKSIHVHLLPDPQAPSAVVKNLASIEGPMDIYFWYEGRGDLPRSGANFMTKSIFAPLFKQKQDVQFCLCSFKGWNFTRNLTHMDVLTPLGRAVQQIRSNSLRWIDSSSFFRYCLKDSGSLHRFMSMELAQKQKTVVNDRKSEMKIRELFEQRSSLFDCIADQDVGSAYPLMRYVEGYYLVQESVAKGIDAGQQKIEIAFVLPNDECKYYRDFPEDLEKILRLDFGRALEGREIHITFQFFRYGKFVEERPYNIGSKSKARVVSEQTIHSYFTFLQKQRFISSPPRDDLHGLNDEIELRPIGEDREDM